VTQDGASQACNAQKCPAVVKASASGAAAAAVSLAAVMMAFAVMLHKICGKKTGATQCILYVIIGLLSNKFPLWQTAS